MLSRENDKSVEDYTARVKSGSLPVFRGHILNEEDLVVRKHILNLMCNLETSWKEEKMQLPEMPEVVKRLGNAAGWPDRNAARFIESN